MTHIALTESLLLSLLARHFDFLAVHGYGEPVIEWNRRREQWEVTYASAGGMAVELAVPVEPADISTHIVAPKARHYWSLDAIAEVPEYRGDSWTRESLDDRFAAEASALMSVDDLLAGDVASYQQRAL